MQKLSLKSRLVCARPSRCYGRASRCVDFCRVFRQAWTETAWRLPTGYARPPGAAFGWNHLGTCKRSWSSGRRRSRSLRPSRSQPFEGLSESTLSCQCHLAAAAACSESVRPCPASGAPQPCENSFAMYIHSMKYGGRRSNRRLSLCSDARNQRCMKTGSAEIARSGKTATHLARSKVQGQHRLPLALLPLNQLLYHIMHGFLASSTKLAYIGVSWRPGRP